MVPLAGGARVQHLDDGPLVGSEPEEDVVLELLEDRPADLVVDGLVVGTLQPGDTISVREGVHPARLVTFERADFYGVLRAKFNLADR